MSIGCFGDSDEDRWKFDKLHQEDEIEQVECSNCGMWVDELFECIDCGKDICSECAECNDYAMGYYCSHCSIELEK